METNLVLPRDPARIIPARAMSYWDRAAGPGDVWAAGYHYPIGTSDYQGLIEHYDGKQWRRVSSVQGGSYTYLSGITAWTLGAGWAVGNT